MGPETQEIVQLWRALSIGGVCMLLGIVAYTLYVYTPVAVRARDPLPVHVTLVAISYSLFVVTAGGTQLEKLLGGDPFSWRLIVVPIATVLGVIALMVLLRDIHRRRHLSFDRRASDPRV